MSFRSATSQIYCNQFQYQNLDVYKVLTVFPLMKEKEQFDKEVMVFY